VSLVPVYLLSVTDVSKFMAPSKQTAHRPSGAKAHRHYCCSKECATGDVGKPHHVRLATVGR
jgi:hypothetical protein